MFSVANEIAYDGLMIQATKNKKSAVETIFSESMWIHVEGNYDNNNWIKEGGEIALQMLLQITNNLGQLPSLYIISPFNIVASNMKQLLKNNIHSFHKSNYKDMSSWINKSVGTINTFQGKQAEVVILLLGGDPKKPGAMNWAASAPNILNVGITRAKNLVFVIGNHNLWSKKAYFQDLSFTIPKVDMEIIKRQNDLCA
jgi:hypothetical protein